MRFMALLILICLAAFTGTALAQGASATETVNPFDYAKPVFDAVMAGQWWAAAAFAVVLLCAAARKYMPASWKTGTKGDIVGLATTFLMAFGGAIATTFAAPGAVMSFAVLVTAAKIGALAIGGYTAIHKVAGWLVAWGKLPSWMMPVLKLLTMMVGSSAVTKAEAAGDKAVTKAPAPTGAAGSNTIVEIE